MKKKKLELNRETLRKLNPEDQKKVQGGVTSEGVSNNCETNSETCHEW